MLAVVNPHVVQTCSISSSDRVDGVGCCWFSLLGFFSGESQRTSIKAICFRSLALYALDGLELPEKATIGFPLRGSFLLLHCSFRLWSLNKITSVVLKSQSAQLYCRRDGNDGEFPKRCEKSDFLASGEQNGFLGEDRAA